MTSTPARFATLTELRAALDAGDVSAVELARDYLQRIADDETNAFISIDEDGALAAAAAADACLGTEQATRLTGLPIAHKDIFCTAGLRTTCGSRMLENFVAPYDATVVTRLRAAGAGRHPAGVR